MTKRFKISVALICLMTSCQVEPSIIGTWSIEKVQFEGNEPMKTSGMQTFDENGNFSPGFTTEGVEHLGTWALSSNEDTLLLNRYEDSTSRLFIKELTDSTLILFGEGTTFYQKRYED